MTTLGLRLGPVMHALAGGELQSELPGSQGKETPSQLLSPKDKPTPLLL